MTGIESWSTTAASNNAAAPNGAPEGMAPSSVNDTMRQMMASVRTWYETAQWINLGYTHTYNSGTSFKIAGTDVTSIYAASRRVKAVGSSTGTIYGSISSSSFSTDTTVNITWDSGSLSNETLTVYVGILTPTNTVFPSTLPSNVVNGSISTFSNAGSEWLFSKTSGGAGIDMKILNNSATSGTSSTLYLQTGTTNAATQLYQFDNATPSTTLTCFSGNSGGITIDSSPATTSPITIKSGSGGITLNPNGGVLNVSGTFKVNSLSTNQILQRVSTETGAVATGTTTTPDDDTIPQNTEGDQYMSLSITPLSATSKLVIEVRANLAMSAATNACMALFQDSTASALAATRAGQTSTAGRGIKSVLTHIMTSGTTSATTFKVRIGADSAATVTFNGTAGGRIYGGVMASSISIIEYTS